MMWPHAEEYCSNLVLGPWGGWRLPHIDELRALIRGCPDTQSDGSCNVSASDCLAWDCFDNVACGGCSVGEGPNEGCYWPPEMSGQCESYWSSVEATTEQDKLWFWGINFSSAFPFSGSLKATKNVRCVGPICPEQKDCSVLDCGPDPVCGESCGTCGPEGGCGNDNCEATEDHLTCPTDCPCIPQCTGLACGKDPLCGESCGTCGDEAGCVNGHCMSKELLHTWTDPATGLTWQNPPADSLMNWYQAVTYCQQLPLAGEGWHLPTIDEVRSLIRGCPATQTNGSCNVASDQCMEMVCYDEEACEGCGSGLGPGGACYWPEELEGTCVNGTHSSSPIEDGDNDAPWRANFGSGFVGPGNVGAYRSVRCVGPICPDSADCSGMECGPDPVCNQICGVCEPGNKCVNGQCEWSWLCGNGLCSPGETYWTCPHDCM